MARPAVHSARCTASLLGAGLLLALAAAPALSGEVYKWKDAQGVTHYADAPPAGGNFESRDIRHRPGMPAPAKAVSEAPAADSQCAIARANLEMLAGEGAVGMDSDGDGKPDAALSAEQRAAQRNLAEAAIRASCSQGATPDA
ncbi:DUF4124 domain-containing protein [Lysobacter sp. A3-1-A15]|uniref:DUF4124 domain-containing protein n=1 Tax=Novilysobacter viscosus TaxID=3098602 RepID=UPI002EDB4289